MIETLSSSSMLWSGFDFQLLEINSRMSGFNVGKPGDQKYRTPFSSKPHTFSAICCAYDIDWLISGNDSLASCPPSMPALKCTAYRKCFRLFCIKHKPRYCYRGSFVVEKRHPCLGFELTDYLVNFAALIAARRSRCLRALRSFALSLWASNNGASDCGVGKVRGRLSIA